MSLMRWIPTFLAFPAGGLLAVETVGGVHDAASGAAGGLIAGAVIGAGQWLALRGTAAETSPHWIAATAGALGAGLAASAAITGAGTEVRDVVLTGALSGAAVGAAQAALLPRGRLAWAAATSAGWAAGWAVTASVIVDLDRGYVVFGSSGALTATLLTGVVLSRLTSTPRVARPA